MTNKEISRALKLIAALGELHNENPFKLKSFTNAAFNVNRAGDALAGKSLEELILIPGIGKSIALQIIELLETGSTEDLRNYAAITPAGVIEMLGVKGIGPKKVATIWRELGIESPGELLYACYENRLVDLKGFGAKTQDTIRIALEYRLANQGKLHFAEAELVANNLIQLLNTLDKNVQISYTGELRRYMEVIENLELLIVSNPEYVESLLKKCEQVQIESILEESIHIKIAEKYSLCLICCDEDQFEREQLLRTGPAEHLAELDIDSEEPIESEKALYEDRGFPFILPELRDLPLEESSKIDTTHLVQWDNIRGILHNHSTYSDGIHSLEEMALACRDLGMEYLGICDHSKSAFYAGGLSIEKVIQQHAEIDKLNAKLGPFKIFKGIESDILSDGSLDYPNEILESFDLVVASVHSILNMDIERATKRLITSIENPFTTILGHPTGRLLLLRKGYPIDYKKVIDACAANGVIMELNAHPYRLDIDWRWIPYCMEKGVQISINPDAHKKEGYSDMQYGVYVARKGGLTNDFLFNGKSLNEMIQFLSK
jgi:DNA polymerase (family 10)